jgi:hypothetical protein
MAIQFSGWTGDFTTKLPKRKPLRALVGLSYFGGTAPIVLALKLAQVGPEKTFTITPTIPGAQAHAKAYEYIVGGELLGIDIEIDPAGDPWPAGPNLVYISAVLQDPKTPSERPGTFASIIVPEPRMPLPGKAPSPRLPI